MRVMIKGMMPAEAGNDLIKSGKIATMMEHIANEIKPEAAYFFLENGMRTMILIVEMDDSSRLPKLVEPILLAANASVEVTPVMNMDELQRGTADLPSVIKKFG